MFLFLWFLLLNLAFDVGEFLIDGGLFLLGDDGLLLHSEALYLLL